MIVWIVPIVPVVSKKGSDVRDDHMETLPRQSQTTQTTETTSIPWFVSKCFETTGTGAIGTIMMETRLKKMLSNYEIFTPQMLIHAKKNDGTPL